MTVLDGDDVRFSCIFEGSAIVPAWRINGEIYTWSSLPDRHTFNGKYLFIENVDVSMNGTTYQCFIPGVAQSIVGILTVITMSMYTINNMIITSYSSLSSSIVAGTKL